MKGGSKPGKAKAKGGPKAAPAKPAARAAQPKAEPASPGRGTASSSSSGGRQNMGKVRPLRDRVLVKTLTG